MKKFYAREREMEQLRDMQQQAYEDYSRFVVLTGRRRVGKTRREFEQLKMVKCLGGEAVGVVYVVKYAYLCSPKQAVVEQMTL